MSETVHSFQVVLDEDVDKDFADRLTEAMLMMRHVRSVVPITTSFDSAMAEMRANTTARIRLIKLAQEFGK